MLRRRFPVTLLKGTIGLGLAVLLIAPVAVLWSFNQTADQGDSGSRKPLQAGGPNAASPESIATEIAFMQKSHRDTYARAIPVWTPEMGSPRIGNLGVGELDSPDTIILPMGKGSFHSSKPAAVAEGLKRDRGNDPQSLKGEYFIAQLSPATVNGKSNEDVRKAIASTGAEILEFVPNNAFLVRVKPKDLNTFQASSVFSYVGTYEPAYKIHPQFGLNKLYSASKAASDSIDVVLRLHRGEPSADLERDIVHGGGSISQKMVLDNGQTVIAASLKSLDVASIAKRPEIFQMSEAPQWRNLSQVTSIQVEMGRLLDPRTQGGTFVRPFYSETVDGGGTYVTDPNQIPGCTPFNPATGSVDPNCYIVQPQFVGLVDNGISLDAAPLAHSTAAPCTSANSSCTALGLGTGLGVGATHRKVEVFVKSTDKNHDLVADDTGEGDFLSCDAISSGGDTHGMVVASTMLGNPSGGQFGLGFTFSDVDNSNQFFSYFNDTSEKNIPMDGQAPGARLEFIDAQGTGSAIVGPPPCATNLLSDVNVGPLVIDEVQALAFRRDVNGLAFVPTPPNLNVARGAKVIVLPFGSPTNFDNNIFNGHNTYAGNAQDIDRFLFANRRILTVVPVGNDGADPNSGANIDPFTPTNPNDTYTAADIQTNDLATGKNIVSVGSNNTDTISLSVAPTDETEFSNHFSSKGPATFASGRISPLVLAPGSEPSIGNRAREGAFSDDFFESHAVIVSFDDDQAFTGGSLGSPELVKNQGKIGTSFSAGKVGGAAAQIRDYFAKGYYPQGIRGSGPARRDLSGPLVKAILIGSADFAQSDLIVDAQRRFSIQQGYGKVELANILPLKSYSRTIRPANSSVLDFQPDTPVNMIVVDEFWDGGAGYGVVPLGGRRTYSFHMDHGGASFRAFLAWFDKEGELLNNNLDLEIQDGDYDDTPGTHTLPVGHGTCGPQSWRDITAGNDATNIPGDPVTSCGNCLIAGDPTADPNYFDANGVNPFFRRYFGNHFTDRTQMSHFAECDANGVIDPAGANSTIDKTNPTEGVYLYYTQGNPGILGPTNIGSTQGTGSSGAFRAIVSYPDDPNKVEMGAPNAMCVSPGINAVLNTAPAGNDVILTTADGLSYIGSGVDDPNTAGVDEARCDTTKSGDDVQEVPNGTIAQPFGLVMTGPATFGSTKTSRVETDKNVYDCSDTSMLAIVTEDTLTTTSTATISNRTTIQVLNSSGAVVDTESGLAFTAVGPTTNQFRVWRFLNFTSESKRVQYIGGLTPPRNPIANNGLVEVNDGQTIRVVYNDTDPGDASVSASAKVSCRPNINEAFTLLTNTNAIQKFVAGGCDIGRFRGNRGDFNFDAKEKVQYQVFFTNHSSTILNDVKATLTCQNPVGATHNPCGYLTLVDPVQNLGRLPFGREGAAAWNIQVAEGLKADVQSNTLPAGERVVLMHVDFAATNSDFGTGLVTQGFTFREALQADNQRLFYATDHPTGGTAAADYNKNGLIETEELANGAPREERELRTYQTWLGTTNNSLAIASGACGASPCIPFSFDNNDGGLTNKLAPDSKPGSGYPTSTQGWWYGTGGACGWQSQKVSLLATDPKGVWHAGQGPIQSILSAGVCGNYFIPTDASTSPRLEFVHWALTSPIFNKVNTGTDARGFSFDVRMEDLGWNSNEFLQDASARMYVQIDTNIDDDGPTILGESYAYRPPFCNIGARTNSVNGGRRFGPLFDPSPTNGDEVGRSSPLAAYDAGNFLQRPFMPYPAVDSDGDPNSSPRFTSDERISTGLNCGSVPVGLPCRLAGFTTQGGPVRNRDIDTGASFEDFNGASGNRFQFELNWQLTEGGTGAVGWTVDDVVFQWSEQHPTDQLTVTTAADGGCSIDGTNGFPAGTQGVCTVNTCTTGPRTGLFCRTGRNDDCRLVAAEGTCSSGTCTTGQIGKTGCADQNDCDLGTCQSGNTQLGCGSGGAHGDADCNLNTNECDAIPVRPVTGAGSSSNFAAGQCAVVSFEKLFTYDCTSSIKVTVQDESPLLCTAVSDVNGDGVADGCTTSPKQVLVNARSGEEPLGETFKLTETAANSGVFTGDVQISGVTQQKGILFLQSNPAENTNLIVSYHDPECDLNHDGISNQSDFTDVDGDGVKNFGIDGVLRDQDPVKTYIGGVKTSDDDDCFDGLSGTDVFNPAGLAQIPGLACHVDPNHNETGQCDADDDGIGDICDNCPTVANSDQLDTNNNGIGDICEELDIDHDGFPNTGDNCPTVYNPSQAQIGGTGHGGSRFNRGTLCDSGLDVDGDGLAEQVDNCPNEQIKENGSGGFLPGPCPGGTLACTYNPDQRDTDADGVGDVCDSDDFDGDAVINNVDNCPTIYNPADPAFQVQADSDGDGRGDDAKGQDIVGVCQPGNANAGVRCVPVGASANCITGGTGAFCIQSSDPYCDYRSTDNDNNGVPDDLTQFATQIDCNYGPGGLGTAASEVGAVALSAVAVSDDGTADPICIAGDPDPNDDPAKAEPCTGRTNAECDTPGFPGTGICANVPDGIMDPGEVASVRLTVANQTVDAQNLPRTLTNVTIGIRAESASIGCVTKGSTFVGTLPTAGTVTTAANALQFIVSPTTGQSVPTQFAEAQFIMTVLGDGIQGNGPDQTFKLSLDLDISVFPQIANACGGTKLGGGLSGGHLTDAGALCEDFDTDRNSNGTFQWTRLYLSADPNGDTLLGITDPNDDVLGSSVDGGPVPFGVSGLICSTDTGFAAARATCHVVPSENDWHLHSGQEGCDPSYEPSPSFAASCAPEARSHSGFRSLHMGRHLNATNTLFDTYRMRQTSAFVMDAVNLGTSTTLDFWHIISVCDDKCNNAGAGNTFAGGQIQISLLNGGTNKFDLWQRITPTQNGYNSLGQNIVVICEFDPGDDQNPPNNETICATQPQWSDMGDLYANDRTCVTDLDNNDPIDHDCGSTTNRTVDTGCSWVSDPNCGSFLENGGTNAGVGKGRGVWAREQFNLSAFSGRRARLRWLDQMGGGWNFGESRSFLEPEPGFTPSQYFDLDDGWYVDDIRLTDLHTSPASTLPDPSNGLSSCPNQGDPNNCSTITINLAGQATDSRTGGMVLRAQSGDLRTGVALDARTTTGNCTSGVLEYQWSELDANQNVVRIIQPFSSDADILVAVDKDTTYKVEVRCSSLTTCMAMKTVQVQVYTGDGSDINNATLDSTTQPLDGLRINHDPNTNTATLTWRARPQVPGEGGYDVFKRDLAGPGVDIFSGGVFASGACFSNAVAQAAAGTEVSKTDTVMPATAHASLYMVGHSSNNTLAIAPLGFRPSVSTRANQLVSAAVTCP